ncbi:hypothetical protein EUX98_g3200 [Antrodiella citrinella]|uniref:Signal recognition particle SRP19 subunit n=1 Tax=Antrodiella citrinella TaxID=2447956 RepID=A0A4S4MX79_9APHY|nr:hypothetical protein EUX98_g3200 [Antrodiella citrinella]
MSRRAAIIEDFDDDTDLPLPSKPLPSNPRGPILAAVDSDGDEDDEDDDEQAYTNTGAGPASPQGFGFKERAKQGDGGNVVTDITPYKKWTCVYPIYIDAKRSYGTGERRIARGKSVWWPLSKDIAEATNRLGLGTLHEANKSHPRDWENPGRVRVQWKKDGRLMNPSIKTNPTHQTRQRPAPSVRDNQHHEYFYTARHTPLQVLYKGETARIEDGREAIRVGRSCDPVAAAADSVRWAQAACTAGAAPSTDE